MRLGAYEVLGELARGGMGVIYRAHDPALGRDVAIKVLATRVDETARARFRIEGEALARLNHPNILGVHAVGADDAGRPFFVMPLVDGESLDRRLEREGPLAPRAAADVVRQVALAVQHGHEQGVLHRDLKPGNVLVTRDGRVLLTDFGLARTAAAQGLSVTGVFLGTPAYWPPEQALGDHRSVGPSSDVYGLGATLHGLLTGRGPHESAGASGAAVLGAAIDVEPAPPSRLRAGVPPALDAICRRCLRRTPGARYASAAEVAGALERFLGGHAAGSRLVPALAVAAALSVAGAVAVVVAKRPREELAPVERPEATTAAPLPAIDASAELAGARRALVAGDLDLAQRHLDRAVAALGSSRQCVPALLLRFGLADRRGDRAAGDLTRALALAPDDPEALARRSLRHGLEHRPDAAARDAEAAVSLAPRAAWPRVARSGARLALLDLPGALEDAEAAVTLDPRLSQSWVARCNVRRAHGDMNGALEDVDRALELDATHAPTVVLRCAVLVDLGRHEEADAEAERAIALAPSLGRAFLMRAARRWQAGDPAAALEDAERAIRLEPGFARSHMLLGVIFTRLRRDGEAIAAFARASELDPRDYQPYVNRGALFANRGDWARAVADYDVAIRLEPANGLCRVNRATAYLALGELRLALADAEAALELGGLAKREQVVALRDRLRQQLGVR